MFSQSINSAPGTVRSRRRPRPLSTENSVAQPKAKRQRSTLNEQTFVPPNDAPEVEQMRSETAVATIRDQAPADLSSHMQELTVRTKKRRVASDRISKGDGSTTLTSNEIYTVSKLPALPDRLRIDGQDRQRGAIYSDSGYALSLSHTHAVVWPYSVSNIAPETFTFSLPQFPHPSKHNSDALPLGTLVSASASEHEPGLVVVIPTTGKIFYWESISSAATLDLIRKKHNGLEASVSLRSGETVIQILNAETAGFVLAFSSGRLAYMSVRDGQGRPAIDVQFLQTGPRGGIFSFLASATGGDIAAIRAGPSTKIGERDVVVATTKGKLQAWELHRGGHNSLRADLDLREQIVTALRESNPAMQGVLLESFELLDLAFSPMPSSNRQPNEGDVGAMDLFLFTSVTDGIRSHYALVELKIGSDLCNLERIIKISSYTTPVSRTAISRPRIYLPSPALVAFLVFDRSVVMVSMARQPLTPEMQLLGEDRMHSITFEDVVDFRDDFNLEIIGSGEEEPHGFSHGEDHKSRKHRAKSPGVVLLVRGAGLIRIAVTNTQKLITSATGRLSAKNKLEQAVFFRSLENNPLSFKGRPELQFDPVEIGRAALELSEDIIDCKTLHLSSVSANLDQNLQKRATALRSLADHLKDMNVQLDRSTRWGLITDAEKLHGAARMWKTYETALKRNTPDDKERLLTQIVEFIHENCKTEPIPGNGEVDRVRFWFLRDISRIYNIIPWAVQAVRVNAAEEWQDSLGLAILFTESEDYIIDILGGAYDFRENNLELYGLQNETVKNGRVTSDLQDLPPPWTGTATTSGTVQYLISATRSAIAKYMALDKRGPEHVVFDKLANDHAKLVDVACKTIQEHYLWCAAQNFDPSARSALQAEGKKSEAYWTSHREDLILGLTFVEAIEKAIDLAMRHEVLSTLAEIIYTQLDTLVRVWQTPGLDATIKDETMKKIKDYEVQIDSIYHTFGDRWASAVFEHFAHHQTSYKILVDSHQGYVTRFLRSRKEFAKIAWINEVKNEKNIPKAAEILLDLGSREQELWDKKVELSIGKLARLAGGQGYSQREGLIIPDGGRADLMKTKDQLDLIKIQEKAFEPILPVICGAIDEAGGLQLAIERFGNKDALKDTKVFSIILQSNLAKIIAHKALDPISLIDLLTLMGNSDGEQYEPQGREFYLALKALNLVTFSKEEQALNERVIWRRCFIRDDWSEVNNTVLKDDEETAANLRRTALFSTLKACLQDRESHTFQAKHFRKTDFPRAIFQSPAAFQALSPSEVLGACSDADELGLRFSDREESAKVALAADMKVEDERLEVFMQTCQLEKWWQECVTLAKDAVDDEVHRKTVLGGQMNEAAEEVKKLEAAQFEKQKQKAKKSARILAPLNLLTEDVASKSGRSLRASSRRFS